MKVIRWSLFFSIALLAIGFIATELNKAYWDWQVRALCEKDGGVTVYEKVTISKVSYPWLMYTSNGLVILPLKDKATDRDPYFRATKTDTLKEGWLSIYRYEQSIYRSDNENLLSRHVSYGRRGGDFPNFISHPSQFLCGSSDADLKKINTVVTVKE